VTSFSGGPDAAKPAGADDGVDFVQPEGGAMDNIVVGYDGSEGAHRALLRAAELARNGTAVTVVSAVPLDVTSLGPQPPEPSELVEHARQLDEALQLLKGSSIKARGVEAEGNPADVILEEARKVDADLVVVGTAGKNAVERFVLGSVSDKVVHRAPCDVLVVR
jgi:nucleotide-binding universal stress UspA family protein